MLAGRTPACAGGAAGGQRVVTGRPGSSGPCSRACHARFDATAVYSLPFYGGGPVHGRGGCGDVL